jgi:Z1 domain.
MDKKVDSIMTIMKKQGARVIAIGGMVLSRGLTLEGLMISYYSRNAGTYDCLLQMCRWFGYRPNYEDLCRIYLSRENIRRFGCVLEAVDDMKQQFKEMVRKK